MDLRVYRYFGNIALTVLSIVAMAGIQVASAEVNHTRTVGTLPGFGPETIADLVDKVSPYVVNIIAFSGMSREDIARLRAEQRLREDSTRKLRKHFGMDITPDDISNQIRISGSGVIVREDGYIITSLHVVQNARSIKVTLKNGKTYEAQLIGKDRFSDLALLKILADHLPVPPFAASETLRVGDWVLAIGNQFGLEHTVTLGLVSGLGREAKGFVHSFGARTGAVRYIQTDASINPGSSGGPLVNLKGEVVGINSFIRDDAQNIGFAIPAELAYEIAQKLAGMGRIAYPYIGIEMREDIPAANSTEKKPGVEVTKIKLASPASSAGLEAGDIILQIDSLPVYKSDDVSKTVAQHAVGDTLQLKISRAGVERSIAVRIDQLPEENE